MGFSSIPLYNIDTPNWQQHHNQHVLQGGGSGGNHHDQNQHLIQPQEPLSHLSGQPQVGMGGGAGSGPGGLAIRPNSMSERARVAKILPPENQLPCPRCDSTNTKFCYYNNYSLTQPRHFCKACRRYWTNGGALRNVPVGGGCRRNKRSSSKSSSGGGSGGGSSSSSKSSLNHQTTLVGGSRIPLNMDLVSTSGLVPTIPVIPSVGGGTGMSSLMASLAQFGMGNLGLSFGGALNAAPHPLGGQTRGGGGGNHHLDFPQLNPSSTSTQVQFPNFLGGFEISGSSNGAGIYTSPFQNDQNEHGNNSPPKNCSSAPIKTENDGRGLNLHKQFMNMSSSDNNKNATSNQFWAGNIANNTTTPTSMWTHLSGLNSSARSHLL